MDFLKGSAPIEVETGKKSNWRRTSDNENTRATYTGSHLQDKTENNLEGYFLPL
jgi:hypothetical protein